MYAIAIYDANLNGNKYVSTNGVNYTIHQEKVNPYKTLEDARFALRQWFPGHTIISFRDAK